MSKAKEEYMKFWNIPEEDLESEDIKQFELMDAYAEQVAEEQFKAGYDQGFHESSIIEARKRGEI